MKTIPVFSAALLALLCGSAAAQDMPAGSFGAAPSSDERIVVLRGVDKIVGRTETIEVSTQAPASFGQLTITARTCEKAPPTERPETTAFLQITEANDDGAGTSVFSGWMFASSPSLNALEHPVYDLWVTDCKTVSGAASSGS
ncbi:MAG: DUF2155 domain-containing protein [Pseudomonadota bacterium]